MITFNSLLREVGIDPTTVRLARHQDRRHPGCPSTFALWLSDDGRFELYQRLQSRPVFRHAKVVATFVVDQSGDTLFCGLYTVGAVGIAPPGTLDPVSGRDVGGIHLYDLRPKSELSGYRGRLVIGWGPGFRSWVQRADRKDKPILEIRREFSPPPFPGFLEFHSSLEALAAIPPSWQSHLRSVRGVYLLIAPDTGEHYVGSATGDNGFWGRWMDYLAGGHGGNRRLRDRPPTDYRVEIPEVASSSATEPEILALETRWKRKLSSREFGLNAN